MAKERTPNSAILNAADLSELQANLKVVGVGGGGGNAVNRMIEVGVEGVEFITMNTDAQVLNKSRAPIKIQLGVGITRGLGAGGNPETGRSAAEESRQEIRKVLEGADLVFITAGLGGGTGTGAAPIIAEIAQELGALTIAVVTKPFKFEGPRRWKVAEEGAQLLRKHVDAMIVVQNDRLIGVSERTTTMTEAFRMADDVLRSGVQGISDIITYPGEINVDFADVRTIFEDAGTALMGIGKGTGENRLIQAVQDASSSKLLEASIYGARRLLVNITAGEDIGIFEIQEAMELLRQMTDQEDANIIYGQVIKPGMVDVVQVTVLATGFPEDPGQHAVVMQPEPRREPHPLDPSGLGERPHNAVSGTRPANPEPPRAVTPPPDRTKSDPTRPTRGDLDIPAFLRRRGQ
ncbi:MAG: cell division protein FtsZ [Fimbriimonadales bacterium]|nr:MAG: cell division protein FtsZ [Fimbriimonadales bacterium]